MSAGLAPALTGYRPMEGSFVTHKREQSRIVQRRFYPLTVFYTTYSPIVTLFGLRNGRPWIGIVFYLTGIPVWSLVEYLFHRYVLHGRFPRGQGLTPAGFGTLHFTRNTQSRFASHFSRAVVALPSGR